MTIAGSSNRKQDFSDGWIKYYRCEQMEWRIPDGISNGD